MRAALYRTGLALTALLCAAQTASASFLDSDFWCRTYGCAVVHDGQSYDIYDNYIFSQGRCCVPVGSRMIAYSNNFGDFNLTGTLNAHQGPNSSQGMQLGITQNGSTVSNGLIDDGDGYLDANDSFGGPFAMNSGTDIALDGPGREYAHSFFITSRNTRFSLRARSSIANSTLDFVNSVGLSDIKLRANIDAAGNDGGFRYGSRASSAQISIENNINDLGDLAGAQTRLINFDRRTGIRRRSGNINDQTIRLDFIYTMPDYDLSMGIGSLNIDMVFDLYREF